MPVRLHEEDPALLREAIRFTSAETGFVPRLIEKDYFCSVVLEYLAASGAGLILQGRHLLVPFFGITNIEASLRFYVTGLGFTMTHQWAPEGRIRWCWLELGGAALMLQELLERWTAWRGRLGRLGKG